MVNHRIKKQPFDPLEFYQHAPSIRPPIYSDILSCLDQRSPTRNKTDRCNRSQVGYICSLNGDHSQLETICWYKYNSFPDWQLLASLYLIGPLWIIVNDWVEEQQKRHHQLLPLPCTTFQTYFSSSRAWISVRPLFCPNRTTERDLHTIKCTWSAMPLDEIAHQLQCIPTDQMLLSPGKQVIMSRRQVDRCREL